MDNHKTQCSFLSGVSSVDNSIFANCTVVGQQILFNGQESSTETGRKHIWYHMKNPISSYAGRVDKLKELHRMFFPGNGENKPSLVAIVGLGGVGKSELARKFAQEYYTEFDRNAVWINAETAQLMQECLKGLAAEIGVKNTELTSKNDVLNMIRKIYEYFSNRKSLFIFDNVEEWINGGNAIKDYLPQGLSPDSTQPYVLMTSRQIPNGKNAVKVLKLSVLEEHEAVKLIQKRICTIDTDLPLQLAKLLGCLPLALQQAISYIEHEIEEDISGRPVETVISEHIQVYLKIFDMKAKKLLLYNKSTLGVDFDEYKTTFLTWKITLEKTQSINPNSFKLLASMAYIDPENIHLEMFDTLYSGHLKSAVNTLLQFSMISRSSNSSMITVHRLVQRVIRIHNKKNEKTTLREMVHYLNQIIAKLPTTTTPYTTSCIVHKQQLWEHILGYPELLKEYKHFNDDYELARRHEMHQRNLLLFQKTLFKYKEYEIYKESSEQYIMIQYFIGRAFQNLHKYKDAKSIYEDIDVTAARKLGAGHPLRLAILKNYAFALRNLWFSFTNCQSPVPFCISSFGSILRSREEPFITFNNFKFSQLRLT